MPIEVRGPDQKVYRFRDKEQAKQVFSELFPEQMQASARPASRVPEIDKAGPADQVLQAATFNLSDEISGAVTAPFSVAKRAITGEDAGKSLGERFSDAYNDEVSYQRERLAELRRDRPGQAIAGDVIGSLIPTGAAVKTAMGGKTLGEKVLRGVGVGAGYGALAGAGAGEGIDDRGRQALMGAGVGAGVGAALPAAGAVAGGATKRVREAVRARRNPQDYATDKVAETLRSSSGREPSALVDELAETRRELGQNMNLADVGGAEARDLVRTASNVPGPGRRAVEAKMGLRKTGQGDRIKEQVRRMFQNPDGYSMAKDEIIAARRTAAKPFYDKAYETPTPFTNRLERILQRPSGRAALAKAQRIADDRGVPFQQWFGQVDETGNLVDARRVPDTRAWDHIKRTLDGMVEDHRTRDMGPFRRKGLDDEGHAIDKLRRDLLDEVDRLNPAYKAAREASVEGFEADEAIEFGREVFNKTPEQVRKMMAGFNEGQREIARIGAAEALRQRIERGSFTANSLRAVVGNKNQYNTLRYMFPDTGSFNQFIRAMMNESRMQQTAATATGNSSTARQQVNLQAAGGMSDAASDIGAEMLTGSGGVAAVTRWLGTTLRQLGGFTPDVANNVQRILLATSPEDQARFLREIQRITSQRQAANLTRAQIRDATTGFLGLQAEELTEPQRPQMTVRPTFRSAPGNQ